TEIDYEDIEYRLDQTDTLQQITPTKVPGQSQESSEVQFDVLSAAKILTEASSKRVKTYDRRRRSTDSSRVSIAEEEVMRVLNEAKILAEASSKRVKTYDRKRRITESSRVSTAEGVFSTAEEILCTDEMLAQKLNEEEKEKSAARKEQ
ncbi:hypothetical protein Tco_0280046, partial [Tanacetum coccineum]